MDCLRKGCVEQTKAMTRDPENLTPVAIGLDYAGVARYWRSARPSILGPYMMDGFGFPAGAGQFRFRAEKKVVSRLIRQCSGEGTALDLGSGIGHWTEFFAHHFAQVVAVEASQQLYDTLEERCSPLPNVTALHQNVQSFQPRQSYEIVFTGGLLMYLNDVDVVDLLGRLRPCLGPGSLVICRESTVRGGVVTRNGDYQAVYRSVRIYERLFREAGFEVVSTEPNVPYILMQMGCELIKRWKTLTPRQLQFIPVLGRLTYLALRLGNPWITTAPAMLGLAFPELTNHFFALRRSNAIP
jgi:trans-aconitate methyltransferase